MEIAVEDVVHNEKSGNSTNSFVLHREDAQNARQESLALILNVLANEHK